MTGISALLATADRDLIRKALGVGRTVAKPTITVIGDSLGAYGSSVGSGGNPGGQPDNPTNVSIPAHSFAKIPGVPYRIVANRAVGGVTIDTVITNQLPLALADPADILWVHCGVNNLNPAIDATLPSNVDVINKMRQLIQRAILYKQVIILDAICPIANGSISGAATRRADIPIINEGYKALADEFDDVYYNDCYTPLAASPNMPGVARGDVNDTDGIHLNGIGAFLAGYGGAAALQNVQFEKLFDATTVFPIPNFKAAGGTVTGGGITDYVGLTGGMPANVNYSVVTNNAGVLSEVGYNPKDGFVLVKVKHTGAAASVMRIQFVGIFAAYIAGLAIGDRLYANALVNVNNVRGLSRVDLVLSENPAGGLVNSSAFYPSTQEDPKRVMLGKFSYELKTFATLTTVPAGLNLVVNMELQPGGEFELQLNSWSMGKVTLV